MKHKYLLNVLRYMMNFLPFTIVHHPMVELPKIEMPVPNTRTQSPTITCDIDQFHSTMDLPTPKHPSTYPGSPWLAKHAWYLCRRGRLICSAVLLDP
jgi:hypothetical protein